MTPRQSAQIETIAAIFGVAGAYMVAQPGWVGWGNVAFLFSNVGWFAFAHGHRHWRMLLQHIAFLGASLLGLWNWVLAPIVGGAQ